MLTLARKCPVTGHYHKPWYMVWWLMSDHFHWVMNSTAYYLVSKDRNGKRCVKTLEKDSWNLITSYCSALCTNSGEWVRITCAYCYTCLSFMFLPLHCNTMASKVFLHCFQHSFRNLLLYIIGFKASHYKLLVLTKA